MKYAFLFSGQGSQFKGMAQDICENSVAARDVIAKVSEITGKDIPALLWETEKEVLSKSNNSQIAISTMSLAIIAALREKGIEPSAVAGFSLGEFPALCAAGVLSFEDMVRVVSKRGEIMQDVCDLIAKENAGAAPGMAAVIGISPEKVVEACRPYGTEGEGILFPANLNSPKQTVISGTHEGIEKGESLMKEAGARRYIKLAVAGPFHSPLMQRAADAFNEVLNSVIFNDPLIPLFGNVTGKRVSTGAEAKENALLHLTNSLLWTDEETNLANLMKEDVNDWELIECGPGKTLFGFWRDSGFNYREAEDGSTQGFKCNLAGTWKDLEGIK